MLQMKKYAVIALAALTALSAQAARPLLKGVTPPRKPAAKAAITARAPQAEVIVNEDFSKFADGSESAPAAEIQYVDDYYVPEDLTAQPGWTSQGLHPAGGAVALMDWTDYYDELHLGYISTPPAMLGGTVTVTFRAKALGEGAGIWLALCDDYYGPGSDQTDIKLTSEWKEYSFVATEASLEDPSYFQFQATDGHVLLDDVKVVLVRDRIAAPVMYPAENLSTTSFRAKWDPTDAPAYRFNAYRVAQAATVNEGWLEEDFNSYDPASGTCCDGWHINAKPGSHGTSNPCLTFDALTDTVLSPVTPEPIDGLSVWLKPLGEEPEDAETVSLLRVEIHHAVSDSWEVIAHLPGYWMNPDGGDYEFQAEALGDDADRVRLSVIQLGGCTFQVDDVAIHYRSRGVTEPVVTDLMLTDTEYTVTDIDPKADYYYYVEAVDGDIISAKSEIVWVDGIRGLAVQLADASDVSPTAFTANWQQLGHATSYKVEAFRVIEPATDMPGTVILEESFDGITEAGSDWQTSFDYGAAGMASSGWCSTQPVWEPGMAGSNGTSWYGAAGLVYSPRLNLSGAAGAGFTVAATVVTTVDSFEYNGATHAEGIVVGVLNSPSDTQYVSAQIIEAQGVGAATGKVFVPCTEGADFSDVIVAFMSMSGRKFFVDNVRITQDLKAGESITAPYAIAITDGLSHTFSGLDTTADHAYAVTASTSRNYTEYTSERSAVQTVKTSTGGITDAAAPADGPAQYFTLQGISCAGQPTAPGIYIRRQGTRTDKVVIK